MARDDIFRFDPAKLKEKPPLTYAQKIEAMGPVTKYLGWTPFEERTDEQRQAHEDIVALMPEFKIGGTRSEVEKSLLWDYAKAVNGGKHFLVFYQQTGSCFPAGTPVRMSDGEEKPVEDVKIGDTVLTHTGDHKPVTQTMSRKYTGKMVTFSVKGYAFPLTCTEDHPIAVWEDGHLKWVEAGDLTEQHCVLLGTISRYETGSAVWLNEYVNDTINIDDLLETGASDQLSRPQASVQCCLKSGIDAENKVKLKNSRYEYAANDTIHLTKSFARFIGLYLAEGGVHDNRVTFTFSRDEQNLVQEVLQLTKGIFGVEAQKTECDSKQTVTQVRIGSSVVAKFLKEFVPGNVYTKRVPSIFMGATADVKKALISAWMDGDGYRALDNTGRRVKLQGVTASKELAKDLTILALSCGLRVSCSKRKARKQSKEAYDLYFSGRNSLNLFPDIAAEAGEHGIKLHAVDGHVTPFGYARRVVTINDQIVEDLTVYDFEVADDHSFIANGYVVHNCVGNGGGQAVWYLSAVDQVMRGEAEESKLPFYLYTYGKGRERGGLRGRGEGSFGAAQAEAAREDGMLFADIDGLPKPSMNENSGITWGADTELEWSDGAAIARKWDEIAKQYPVKTTAQARSAKDVREGLFSGYPTTIASDWGGEMRPSVKGNTVKVLLNSRADRWMHQMCVIGCMKHPEFGWIYYILNSWGPNAHGKCPSGAPPGGFWVLEKDIEYIVRQGDSFIFSGFEGFPAREIEKALFKLGGTR